MNSITLVGADATYTFDNTKALIQTLNGFEFYDHRPVIENVPGRDGSLFVENRAGSRRLAWEGKLIGTSLTDWLSERRELLSAIDRGLQTVQFVTDDGLSLQVEALVDRVLLPMTSESVQHGQYALEIVAPDWRLYGQTLHSTTTGITSLSGGTPIPTAIPLSLATASIARPSVTNAGNESTPPTLTIQGPGTGFTVQNITTGEYFTLSVNLTAGDSVTIDVVNRTVLQGSTNVYGNFTGTWWLLRPGVNEINFVATSGSDSSTRLTVSHRDAYKGV